jgi:Flp pilus assembly pilin Flp
MAQSRYVNHYTMGNSVPGSGLSGQAVVGGCKVRDRIRQLWVEESGQDVAEYAVMLAVILVIVIGTVRLIGGNANNVFSQVGNSLGTQ